MLSAIALSLASWCAVAPALAQDARPAPEAATGRAQKEAAVATRHMAVCADPLAAAAARDVLRQGGSAIDAAIAAQLVLGLVEPQSSGLGGGAFIVHWDAANKGVKTYDARETAPAAARSDRFFLNGARMSFPSAVGSGFSVGVPGVVRGMEMAHRRHGKLPWAKLFGPAIKLAEDGFPMSRRLSALLAGEGVENFTPAARAYFFDVSGNVHPPGFVRKNPEYAGTLRAIAAGGADAFYSGVIAEKIVAAVAAAPIAKGDLTLADLSGYSPKERAALCFLYRARKICGMGPPSSGALTIAQTLKMIEPLHGVTGAASAMSAPAIHAIAEAQKLAFADRNRYVADPDFVRVPEGLLDDIYLAGRRAEIDLSHAMSTPSAGIPPVLGKRAFGADQTVEAAGTSHLSIVDDAGNAVAMTTTIENAFGSRIWAAGFLLNNELTDFSFEYADKSGQPIANRVEAGKRPRSSMAPTLVFGADGDLETVTGSPGGANIILFMIKTLVALIDWGIDAQGAADLANFGSDGGAIRIEPSARALWPALALKGYGHDIDIEEMASGVHTIVRKGDRLYGGVDPRREGVALGD